ncbi:MAG: hypothetical protein KatS3mg099_022 [Candidatus Parcubacteria bacterium]|nr:MAG: hypothetical protein KatS3mg099_022 [Candidatus Parcubacteria bacterium]
MAEKLRQLASRYVGEIVYGANDGIITTFAVVTAAAGGKLSAGVIVILGVANLLADGFSMGASSFLSDRAESSRDAGRTEIAGPLKRGAATFFAFVVAGALPLLPYVFFSQMALSHQLVFSVSATLIALALVGVGRAYLAKERVWLAVMEMVAIGGLAAAISYTVGWLLREVVGVVV